MHQVTSLFFAAALAASTAYAQTNSVSFVPVGTFSSSAIQKNGLAGPIVNSGTQYDLFITNYGAIATGNTISRCDFIATMGAAFLNNTGGVFDFEDANAVYDTTADPANPTRVGTIDFDGVIVVPGPFHYAENPSYRGKETALFDGTGPSPVGVVREWFDISGAAGKKMGNTTSWDLDFDPLDEVSVVGFGFLNANDFQSYQRTFADYPNVHVHAGWTNGVNTIEQMAVQYSQQDDVSNCYFGFKQPAADYFLDYLRFYVIGNTWRVWAGMDDLGIATGNGAAVSLKTPGVGIGLASETEFDVGIMSTMDCMYQLQKSPDMSDGNWADEGDPVIGTGAAHSWTLPVPASAGDKVFYRVEVP